MEQRGKVGLDNSHLQKYNFSKDYNFFKNSHLCNKPWVSLENKVPYTKCFNSIVYIALKSSKENDNFPWYCMRKLEAYHLILQKLDILAEFI